MTRKEAILNIKFIGAILLDHVTKEQRELIDSTFIMAIEALQKIYEIESIISIDNSIIQEDVLKYKMICEVIKYEGYN